MGLNVYFCDVCGVRVTDVDLRSGHGMLRGQDVICATCLDMGHGKEWLASRGLSPAAPAAARTPAPAASASARSAAAVLERAPTVPERPAVVVAPHADEEATTYSPPAQVAVAPPPPVIPPRHDTDYAGAAAGLAALGNRSSPAPSEEADAVEQVPPPTVDPTLLKDEAEGAQAEAGEVELEPIEEPTTTAEVDEEVAALGARHEAPPQGKSRGRAAAVEAKRPSTAGSKSSSANGKKSSIAAAKSSSANAAAKSTSSKFNKPKSSRSAKAAGGGMPLPIKISLITIPLILLLAFGAYAGPGLVGGRAPDVKDMPAQKNVIEKALGETLRTVNAAVGSKDLKTLQAANSAWLKFENDFEHFCENAKKYSRWTDDNCADYSSQLKIMDLSARMRLIRDDMVKLQNRER